MEKNGNSAFVRLMFWSLILTSFGWTTATFWVSNKQVNAVEQCSIGRDVDERKERELLGKDISRIDANQVITMKNVDKVLDNQNHITQLLTRLETKIEKIQ